MLCVKWEMKPNDTAGRLCVDIGHPHPDNNLVHVEKTFEPEEEEGRRPDYMPVRGLWSAGWQGGEMLDPQVCQAGG